MNVVNTIIKTLFQGIYNSFFQTKPYLKRSSPKNRKSRAYDGKYAKKAKKRRKKKKKFGLVGEDLQKDIVDRKVNLIINKVVDLRLKNPISSEFLGEEIEYPKKRKGLFARFKPIPDLSDLRDDVDKFLKREKVINPRKKIAKLLSRYPFDADLHAIRGIQIFNDTAQSGLDEKKLDALQQSLIEIATAIYNEGISIFNINWFVKIYIKYLELMQKRLAGEYTAITGNHHWRVRQAADELHIILQQVTQMMSIKNQLAGLAMLNAKIKGTGGANIRITKYEVREACNMILSDGNAKIGTGGKTAKHIIWEVITISSLLARIPIFRKLLGEIMNNVPDTPRGLMLQKNMVGTLTVITDFQFALAIGDTGKSIEVAHRLYNRCLNTISDHINYTNLTKLYEVDPYLKAAWVAKESKGLFESSEYRKMLRESLDLLNVVIENADNIKGSYELARQLQEDIEKTMVEHGWSPFE
ncbi:MAG: hypothetical protein GY866_32765 [Proteobacteria bacterium]|nr:hypothetical protein [Pseudomonadota bacterium]